MSDCCKKLEAEIAALRSAIDALDGKFIPKSQRKSIIDEAIGIANGLFLGLSFKSQVSGMIQSAVNPVNAKAIEALTKAFQAESVAGVAKGRAENALSNAIDAQLKSKAARDAATAAGQTATRAKTIATTANDVATTAKNAAGGAQRTADQARRFAEASEALAKTAKGTADQAQSLAKAGKSLADKALGTINKVEDAVGKLEGKLQDVASKALKALGASESAISKAGAALSKAGDSIARVASLAGAVAGILALIGTFVSFQRIEALERVVDRQGNDLSSLYGIMYSFKARLDRYEDYLAKSIRRLDDRIEKTYDFAGQAFDKAIEALRKATEAFSIGMNARNMAINAEKTAQAATIEAAEAGVIAGIAQGAAIGAVSTAGNALRNANTARQIGSNAQGTAERALRQAARPGRDGAPGRPGRDGAPGRPGRDGKNAAPLTPTALIPLLAQSLPQAVQAQATRIRPFIINTGGGNQTMRTQDLALLRRIDSTTRANLATSRSNSVQASIMLGLQQKTNALVTNVQATANTINQNLGKLAKWLHLDRLLNLLTFVTAFHNAYQLSSAVGQTLFSATSNVLAVFGVKDANGSPIDVGSLIGGSLDAQMKAIFGVEEWNGMKKEWREYNRVYQAAANLMFSIQSMIYNVQESINIVAGWIAQMGNGLRKDGVVSEGIWRRFNPNPDFKNPFFSAMEKLENLEEATSQIDQIASNVLSVQQTGAEIVKQKEELHKSVAQVVGGKEGTIAPDATKVAEVEAATKLVSKSVSIPQSAETAGV